MTKDEADAAHLHVEYPWERKMNSIVGSTADQAEHSSETSINTELSAMA